MIPRVSVYRVWLTGLKGTADLAAMLKELTRFLGAYDSSDSSSLNVILK